MSDQSLAKVDDVIEHGEAIPANVVRFTDVQGACWRRIGTSTFAVGHSVVRDADDLADRRHWWPLTVVEVDPEPQPAETLPVGAHTFVPGDRDTRCQQPLRGGRLCGRSPLALMHEANEPAESGPVVLSLPQVPDGAVALIGIESGARYESPGQAPNGGPYWAGKDGYVRQLGALLDDEREVTVEFVPPREPRTWPKLDDAPDDVTWLRGASGTRYGCDKLDEGVPVFRAINDLTDELEGRGYSFHVLQFLDGPLTEVLDGQ